jgi:transposase InsO family protein
MSASDQDAILMLRRERGYGASKIKSILKLPYGINTIHRFLKRRGLTAITKNYRRPRLQGTKHMYLKNTDRPGKLQMDIKYVTPELSGLSHTTYLYAVIDIYTRWKYGVILEHLDQSLCIKSLMYILPRLPKELRESIDFIQTDNGLEFQVEFHKFVTEELSGTLGTELGLKHSLDHHYTHKSSPNENAVIERSFRTDEEEFFWRIPRAACDFEELNDWYREYIDDYNTFRPHLGLKSGKDSYHTPKDRLDEYFSKRA